MAGGHGGFDAFDVVREAVAIVCEVSPDTLTPDTRFAELHADSLARVSIADVVEASVLTRARRSVHLDDGLLGRVESLRELTDYVIAGVD
jgi:acyl carrier protein